MNGQDWPAPEPDRTTVMIGDVHGCMKQLSTLMEQITEDLGFAAEGDPAIVFVGDYVDRGDASAEVLRFVYDAQRAEPGKYVALMGNHERMMLDFMEDPTGPAKRWLKFGGLETIASMGLSISQSASGFSGADLIDLSFDMQDNLGDELIGWMENLPVSWNSGNLWAVHAAADPALPMTSQDRETLLWGHGAFETLDRKDGQWVAHGHTPVDEAEASRGRIRLDTGAVYGNKLSAARVDPDGLVQFMSA